MSTPCRLLRKLPALLGTRASCFALLVFGLAGIARATPPPSLSLAWTGVGNSFFIADTSIVPLELPVSEDGSWTVPNLRAFRYFQGASQATFLSQRPTAGKRFQGIGSHTIKVQIRLASNEVRWVPWMISLVDRTPPTGEIILTAGQQPSSTSDGIPLYVAPVTVHAATTAKDNIAVVSEDPALTDSSEDNPAASKLSEYAESRLGRHQVLVTIRDTSGNKRILKKVFEIRALPRIPFAGTPLSFSCAQGSSGQTTLSMGLRFAHTAAAPQGFIRKDSLKLFLLGADGSLLGDGPLSLRTESQGGWTTTASYVNRVDAFDLALSAERSSSSPLPCPKQVMLAALGRTNTGSNFELDERVPLDPPQAASNDGGIDLGECQGSSEAPIDGVPVCEVPVSSDPPNSPQECSWIARWIDKPFEDLKASETFPDPHTAPYYPGSAAGWIKWLVQAKGDGRANHLSMHANLEAKAQSPLGSSATMAALASAVETVLGHATGTGSATPPWQYISDLFNALCQKHLARLELSMMPIVMGDPSSGQTSLYELAARGTFRVYLSPDYCPCECNIDINNQRVQFLTSVSHSPPVDNLPVNASLPVSSATAAGGMRLSSECGTGLIEAGVQVGKLQSGAPNEFITVPLTNVSDPEYLVLGDTEPSSPNKIIASALPSNSKAGIATVPSCTVLQCSTDIKTAHAEMVETYTRNSYFTGITISTHLQLALQAALKPIGIGASGTAQWQAQLGSLLAPMFTDSAATAKVSNAQTRFQVTPEAVCDEESPSGNGIDIVTGSANFGGN